MDLLCQRDRAKSNQRSTERRKAKGDSRLLVLCSDVENIVFEREASWRSSTRRGQGFERKVEFSRVDVDNIIEANAEPSGQSTEALTEDSTSKEANVNDIKSKQMQGLKNAEEKETVKCAARRGCIFGFEVRNDTDDRRTRAKERNFEFRESVVNDGTRPAKQTRRLCEAVVNGIVVEPSFAKGDWGIRWRE